MKNVNKKILVINILVILNFIGISNILYNQSYVLSFNQSIFRIIRNIINNKLISGIDNNNLIIAHNKTEASKFVTQMLIKKIKKVLDSKKYCTISLPTGGTPQIIYELLRNQYKDSIDWSRVIFFQLDEYIGLPPTHPQSYQYQLRKDILEPLEIPEENMYFINTQSKNLDAFCKAYEQLIKDKGGIDIMLLGIGPNGHIAFNEPGSSINSQTRIVPVSETTRKANARFFEGDIKQVPTNAITIGLKTILEAKKIMLIASGLGKANAIYQSVEESPTINIPASVLQNHPQTDVIIDQEAAKGKLLDIVKTKIRQQLNELFSDKDIELILSDLDYTLAAGSKTTDKVRQELIQQIVDLTQNQNKKFAIVTGARLENIMIRVINLLPSDYTAWENLYVFAYGGSAGYKFSPDGKIQEIEDCDYTFTENQTNIIKDTIELFSNSEFGNEFEKSEFSVNNDTNSTYKCVVFLEDIPRTKERWEKYVEFFNEKLSPLGITVNGGSNYHAIDITPVDKSKVLEFLHNDLEIGYNQSIYIGDSFESIFSNDRPVVRLLGPEGLIFNIGSHQEVNSKIISLGLKGDLGTELIFDAILEK